MFYPWFRHAVAHMISVIMKSRTKLWNDMEITIIISLQLGLGRKRNVCLWRTHPRVEVYIIKKKKQLATTGQKWKSMQQLAYAGNLIPETCMYR